MILIAVLAGGSMAAYSQSEVNFLRKTIQLVFFQQFMTLVIYLTCFAQDLFSRRH
ncbi:hypothetical protein CWATWH0401_440 [Crocosphaera watsonii WH 0401]|uniref:Uncharacterized protein n=1 Tax=Crocosphaera watsonii WH 0401 TaxID=555881 RepID=T2J9P5_CROWT|nr:hypothetical protein CWATWH0401_440 [Crocosphaera watsonii WH 0401]